MESNLLLHNKQGLLKQLVKFYILIYLKRNQRIMQTKIIIILVSNLIILLKFLSNLYNNHTFNLLRFLIMLMLMMLAIQISI